MGDITGVVKLAQEERYNPKHLLPSRFAELGAQLRVQVTGDPESSTPELRLDLGPQSALVAIDVRTRNVLAMVGSYEAITGGLDRASHSKRQPGSAFKAFVYSYAIHSSGLRPQACSNCRRIRSTGRTNRDACAFAMRWPRATTVQRSR